MTAESLRDRVARVLYESGGYPEEFLSEHPWESIGESEQACELAQADALIAAGLVAEPKTEPYVTCTMCGSTSGFDVGQCKARGRL